MANIKIYGKLINATDIGEIADYSQIADRPILEQDLSASGFNPVANTYYKHTGNTSATYIQGVIYLYNGSEYKAIDGSGSGGDTSVNIVQTTGDSETAVMSQKAVTDTIAPILQDYVDDALLGG